VLYPIRRTLLFTKVRNDATTRIFLTIMAAPMEQEPKCVDLTAQDDDDDTVEAEQDEEVDDREADAVISTTSDAKWPR
jgi:hypothetical protein